MIKIPKVLHSYYKVDVCFEDTTDHLTRYERDYGLVLEPDFQRGHVWIPRQQSAFVEWMLRGGQTGRDIIFNCPGWQKNPKGPIVCVDGLQRITAVKKFLKGEILAFGHYIDDFEKVQLRGASTFKLYMGDYEKYSTVLRWYLQINGAGTPHKPQQLAFVRHLLDAAE